MYTKKDLKAAFERGYEKGFDEGYMQNDTPNDEVFNQWHDKTFPEIEKAIETMSASKISNLAIKSIPYKRAISIVDKEGYVTIEGFGKIHIDNWNNQNK